MGDSKIKTKRHNGSLWHKWIYAVYKNNSINISTIYIFNIECIRLVDACNQKCVFYNVLHLFLCCICYLYDIYVAPLQLHLVVCKDHVNSHISSRSIPPVLIALCSRYIGFGWFLGLLVRKSICHSVTILPLNLTINKETYTNHRLLSCLR